MVVLVYRINPIEDPRWAALVARHPRASVFHTREWLNALRLTYGYQPVAVTSSRPGEDLTNALVFCRIKSWLTGRRSVSLPFADHCDPLVDTEQEFQSLLAAVQQDGDATKAKYIEIRPVSMAADVMEKGHSFCLHQLDLRPSLQELFHSLHENCIRRKIGRAEREALQYEEGLSDSLLRQFYHLLILTRRRHELAPQPLAWFRSIMSSMGSNVKIRIATKDKYAVAGILTLQHRDTMVYKYGCSDARFHNLGGMQLLLWRSIQEAKTNGLQVFDFGRSDWDNDGLIAFKDRWGARRSTLTYFRLFLSASRETSVSRRFSNWRELSAKRVLPYLPERLLCATGSLIYRHIG